MEIKTPTQLGTQSKCLSIQHLREVVQLVQSRKELAGVRCPDKGTAFKLLNPLTLDDLLRTSRIDRSRGQSPSS